MKPSGWPSAALPFWKWTPSRRAQHPPVTLYALMGNPVTSASPKFRALTVFHDHIFQAIRKKNWPMARELIAQCRRLSGASQKLYDLHLARIAYYEKHPPGRKLGRRLSGRSWNKDCHAADADRPCERGKSQCSIKNLFSATICLFVLVE